MDIGPIEARLRAIANAVIFLRKFQELTYVELVQDHRNFSTVLHDFQIAIQAALDIGTTLLAELPGKAPTGYRSIFTRLGEEGVLPKDFAAELEGMAGFRNIIVHMYLEIDPNKVYRSLHDDLEDLDRFVMYVGQYVSSLEQDNYE